MSEPVTTTTDQAMTLARLRATGAGEGSADQNQNLILRSLVDRSGRRLVDVTGAHSRQRFALGWIDGSEPVAGNDSGVERTPARAEVSLTFAAALRCCWPDPKTPPFPGAETTVEDVLAARDTLGTLRAGTGRGGHGFGGPENQRKAALRRLHAAGMLDGDEPAVRLGWVVATWSEDQIDILRTIYDQLPSVPVSVQPRSVATTPDALEEEA